MKQTFGLHFDGKTILPAHDLMSQKDTAHLRVLVLTFIDDSLGEDKESERPFGTSGQLDKAHLT